MDYGKLSSSLSKLLGALEKQEIAGLRKLGSGLGETALVENETLFVEIAVLAYSASKLLEKAHFQQAPAWKKGFPKIVEAVRGALFASAGGRASTVSKKIASANSEIERVSSSAGRFQTSVLQKARIKTGADIYAHGASLGRACELSGAPKEELQPYLGNTKLADKYETLPASERMRRAAALFV